MFICYEILVIPLLFFAQLRLWLGWIYLCCLIKVCDVLCIHASLASVIMLAGNLLVLL